MSPMRRNPDSPSHHRPASVRREVPSRARRCDRRDEGTSLVEFSFVMVLFFILLFGIINFGVILSFKQTMTQAASEASRAAAVTIDDPSTANDERFDAAEASVDEFNAYGRPCTNADMDCEIDVHDCSVSESPGLNDVDDPGTRPDCVTVRLVYDYEDGPILPPFPLIEFMLPDVLEADSTSQISDPGP